MHFYKQVSFFTNLLVLGCLINVLDAKESAQNEKDSTILVSPEHFEAEGPSTIPSNEQDSTDSIPTDEDPSNILASDVTTTVAPTSTTSNETTTAAPTTVPTTTASPTEAPTTTDAPTDSPTTTDGPQTTTTSTKPPPPIPHERHFDAASFFGGIILALTLIFGGFFGYKYYQKRSLAPNYSNF